MRSGNLSETLRSLRGVYNLNFPLMRFFMLLSVCLFFNFSAFAQNEEATENERIKNPDRPQTILGSNTHHGFYWSLGFKAGEINNAGVGVMPQFKMGWIMGRRLALGIEAQGLVPNLTMDGVQQDNRVRPLMGYGGFFLEPIIGSNKAVHVTLPVGMGAGWMGYINDWNDVNSPDLVQDAIFWYVEPGVNAEINLTRALRLTVGASYRLTEKIDLPQADLEGVQFNAGLKVGFF